jgi:hypothetical protein
MEERDDGLTQARRCLEAMAGQEEDVRASLWRCAVKFAARDRASRPSAWENHARSALALGAGVGAARIGEG